MPPTSVADVADEHDDVRDELPEDLDPSGALVGPYLFPNNSRRRVPGYLYLVCSAALVALWVVRAGGGDGVLVNGGMLFAAVLLALAGAFQLISGGELEVDEQDALRQVAKVVEHPIGHASAQMAWRGWTSRPTWHILWYSAQRPPTHRGMATVDGYDGTVLSSFTERNPEDWTDLDDRLEG